DPEGTPFGGAPRSFEREIYNVTSPCAPAAVGPGDEIALAQAQVAARLVIAAQGGHQPLGPLGVGFLELRVARDERPPEGPALGKGQGGRIPLYGEVDRAIDE